MDIIWWEKIPDALSYVAHITESLLDEKSVIIQYSNTLPWRETFVGIVKEKVQQQNASKSFVTVKSVDAPGNYLLEEYCKPEKQTEFRPSIGYPRFFASSDDIVLHQRFFWVEVSTLKSLTKWCDFIAEYSKLRGKGKDKAVFILEWVDPVVVSGKKGVCIYSFDEYISEYDCVVFSTLASSEIREPDVVKNYLSVLAANVVGNDIELIAECIKSYESFLKDPYRSLLDIIGKETRSDFSPYVFKKAIEEVSHDIWLAQIKTVYPAIEEYRKKFIDRHRAEIKKCLPVTSSYGEIYREPEDVEIGTLYFMTGDNFYLPYEEHQELKRFKNARNDLSHLKNLSFDEVKQLF